MPTSLASGRRRLITVLLTAALLLSAALLDAPGVSAKSAAVRKAEHAVAAKVRAKRHVKRLQVTCQDNNGWFGCHYSAPVRGGWWVGNAIARRHRASVRVKLFAEQCVGRCRG